MNATGLRWLVPSFVVAALTVEASVAFAQPRRLTLDDIYDPTARVSFNGSPAPVMTWIDDGRYLMAERDGEGVAWTAVNARDGRTARLFDAAAFEAALGKLPGVSPADARAQPRSRTLTFSDDYSAAVMTIGDDLYVYQFGPASATRITRTEGMEENASFSPNGRLIAFVRQSNLYVVDVDTGQERAVTSDGTEKILNGRLDWVYEEEIYGRGQTRGYWWSPDSSHLAFLRIDDTPVPTYLTTDDIPYDQVVERWSYPKAGDPNPLVRLGVAAVGGNDTRWMPLEDCAPENCLIVRVSWTPDSRRVVYALQDRVQSRLDMYTADRATGRAERLLQERSNTWIDPSNLEPPVWLKDGSFLYLSERSGRSHLYHHAADGRLLKQVTNGAWDVRALHGVDEQRGWVYFSAGERRPIDTDVYRIRIDGSAMLRLSGAPGTHAASFSRAFSMYLDRMSTAAMPTQVRLHGSDGAELRVVDGNRAPALDQFQLAAPEFVQVTTRDGFVMDAMMIKPPDFDPAQRYPVYQFTYGGPQAPRVRNSWGGSEYIYHQLLAQHGIIVWICDNRSASGKGAESAWPIYRRLGELELRDVEDGLAWLKRQPYVDGARIGIHGWSYGGYLTSYAMTHSTSFVMGIAGGTVSDWRDYDSVYTERYLGLPKDNPEGYRSSSPRWAAKDLHGALLLVHGSIDDNVHVANTMQFAYELQRAQKPFEMMLYPRSRHGVTDPLLMKHLRRKMLDFTLQHLVKAQPMDRSSAQVRSDAVSAASLHELF